MGNFKTKEEEKLYNKAYYAKRSVAIREKMDARRKLASEYVCTLKSQPCTDCKVSYHPVVMDFDHLSEDKSGNVSRMVLSGYTLDTIKREIAKCELVCSNCHRMRTMLRRGKPTGDGNTLEKCRA